MTNEPVETRTCPRCQSVIAEEAEVVYCTACGAAYHAACAQAQEGCAVPGCPAAAPAETAGTPQSGNPVPPTPSLRTTFTYGWAALRRFAAPLIGAALIYVLLQTAIDLLHPATVLVFFILLSPPLSGGFTLLAMKAVRGDSPRARDLFAGFARYWRWIGATLLYALIGLAFLLPIIIFVVVVGESVIASVSLEQLAASSLEEITALLIGTLGPESLAMLGQVFLLTFLVLLPILIAVTMRWIFVYNLIADGYGVLAAFGHSARLTKGQRLRLFGITLVIGLILFGAALLLSLPFASADLGETGMQIAESVTSGLGTLLATPFMSCMYAALYYAVKAQRGA